MQRIRVLVVDDSVVVRRLVTDALASDPAIEVVGVAANGRIALTKVEQHAPDLVTMDVEMPVMDGVEAVRELRRAGHRLPVIMFSTLTERGAAVTLDALSAGASDYVTKPSNVGSVQESIARVVEQLVPRIKALVPHRGVPLPGVPLAGVPGAASGAGTSGAVVAGPGPAGAAAVVRPGTTTTPRAVTLRPAPERTQPVRAVVVGSSTGGPEALGRLLAGLTVPLPVPVLVVQHMPPVFTRQLAARLDRTSASTVVEAEHDRPLLPGEVHVAPGDHHLEVAARGTGPRAVLQQQPPVNFCRPSVDVLFRSAVQAWGGGVLAVVLTGMGADGRAGCGDVVAAGGEVLVQDEPTSVVWGMPGAVATAGLAHRVLPLDDVAGAVARAVAAPVAPAVTGPGR